ncbi:MAG: sulfotransferase [Desulfobacteraceae bacterium]|nr:sulfotransferase [Desulfobacteraceae bacterium]
MTGSNCAFPRLVFLLFRSRSGSTFFGDRLSRHPEVLVTPESRAAPRLYEYFHKKEIQKKEIDHHKLTEYLLVEQKLREWNLPREKLLQGLKGYNVNDWASVFRTLCKIYRDWKKPEARVVVFKKSGWYYKNINRLLSTYPDSIAIWMIRDPRAIYNSARKAIHSENNKPMAGNILKNALGWREYMNRLLFSEQQRPDRNLPVYYEYLLHDLSGVLSEIWQKLGVRTLRTAELNEILEERKASHLVTKSTKHLHDNVYQEPLIEHANKWEKELPASQKMLIRIICKKEMKRHGYY